MLLFLHHLGTKIVFGSFLTRQLKSQSHRVSYRRHTHTHTHTHLTHTVLIDIRQNQNSPSAGVPSPFHDPIHNFQRSKFKQFHTQPSRPCLLTLLHSECKDAAGDKTFSSLCAAEHRSETSGRGRPLRSPCWFMLFTFDYYWWCLQ